MMIPNLPNLPVHINVFLMVEPVQLHVLLVEKLYQGFNSITLRIGKALEWDESDTIIGRGCVEALFRSTDCWKYGGGKPSSGRTPDVCFVSTRRVPDRPAAQLWKNFPVRPTCLFS